MNIDHFFNSLPKSFSSLILHLNKLGFRVGLIGGTTRDFLLKGVIGKDFDCELRPISDGDLSQKWQELFKQLSQHYKTQKLAYDVIRITENSWQVELTYPRIEIFTGEKGHSNFTATYVRDSNYTQGFKRRDFTINAILFEKYFEEVRLIDPLNGIEHLKEKNLVPCSEDFIQDPVRFLRALRFKINLQFEFSQELNVMMDNQGVQSLSSHYLLSELKKCFHPMEMFVELCKKKNDFILEAQHFVEHQDQLLKLYNHTQGKLDGLIQAICWCYKIDQEVRKKFISSLGLSLKKYPAMLAHDFTDLVLQEDRSVEEMIKDDKFIEFAQWLYHAFKWQLPDVFFEEIFNSFGLKNFSIRKFKAMQHLNMQLTAEDKVNYDPSQFKFVLMAKKYLLISNNHYNN